APWTLSFALRFSSQSSSRRGSPTSRFCCSCAATSHSAAGRARAAKTCRDLLDVLREERDFALHPDLVREPLHRAKHVCAALTGEVFADVGFRFIERLRP